GARAYEKRRIIAVCTRHRVDPGRVELRSGGEVGHAVYDEISVTVRAHGRVGAVERAQDEGGGRADGDSPGVRDRVVTGGAAAPFILSSLDRTNPAVGSNS